MCVVALPAAVEPLWQVEHRPDVEASWVKLAGLQADVV
jgi:hypothetical protein